MGFLDRFKKAVNKVTDSPIGEVAKVVSPRFAQFDRAVDSLGTSPMYMLKAFSPKIAWQIDKAGEDGKLTTSECTDIVKTILEETGYSEVVIID